MVTDYNMYAAIDALRVGTQSKRRVLSVSFGTPRESLNDVTRRGLELPFTPRSKTRNKKHFELYNYVPKHVEK